VPERRPTSRGRGQRPERAAKRPVAPPVWDKDPYPVTEDGMLLVRVVAVQGPEWIRNFQRWSVRLECAGVFEAVSLSLFLNLGGNQAGPSVPGRQSKFYQHWSMANGGPPKKGQAMSFEVFLDRFFMAKVERATKDSKGEAKSEDEVYSRISHFVRREEMSLPHTP